MDAPTSSHDNYTDAHVRSVLNGAKSVAVVGASVNTARPSYFVVRYLLDKGYTVYPVNPGHASKEIRGAKVYASLADIPDPIDMVDIFRASDAVMGVVEEALRLQPRPKVIWMQLGVRNDKAAKVAEDAGLTVIMNRCPKIEYGRLSGEIGWAGVNSRVISSRKPARAQNNFQNLTLNR